MNIQTYEVTILLNDTGRYLSLLLATTSPASAVADLTQVLHNIGVKDGREYDASETTVQAVDVTPVKAA